ncbi:nucleotidyltransferase family protein [Mucilaginibacter aquaedulcis]|uniref:nucleotidyltransferase family protein n=1 Tax=Mucilaginibacter aquaedulcis TaxID=1187081 RepID=UPI0025B5D246|nr:sugar phosphate nucleotidyltransferase [Mucilaginibacter aquaedulcis]MDN3548787.1 NTP transferase domain-containing protein [Mucilaginibacter aquaedulcis]
MAGGRGLRMMPMTTSIPKPMIEIEGETLISKSLIQLKTRIPTIGITVGYQGAALAKHVIEEGASLVFNTDGQGNCWWLFNTLMKHLDEPVLVLTCDNIVRLDLDFILTEYLRLNSPPCMVIPVKPVKGIDGDYITGGNNIVASLGRTNISQQYCSGIQLLNPAIINRLVSRVDDFNELWDSLIRLEKLSYSSIYPYNWYSVNTIRQFNEANT